MKILIDPEHPGDFNQALMDLGTDIESAKNPRPAESPIRSFNAAYLHGTYDKYPIKKPKKNLNPYKFKPLSYEMPRMNFYWKKIRRDDC